MSKPGEMQFKYQYADMKSLTDAYKENKFASNIKSYIGDGEDAFKNEEYGNKTRQAAIADAKKNLEKQMKNINELSHNEAAEMRNRFVIFICT